VTRHPDAELSAYAAGSLADDERAPVERHLADCVACRATVADFRLLLDRLATTAPAPPDIAWPRYRAELRRRRETRVGTRVGTQSGAMFTRWLRPVPLAAATAVAAACAIVLYLANGTPPPADLASMEYEGLAARMELIDNYRAVEQLDLLEDLDVIRNLDRLAPTREG
jgi:anti-sigma factor RsiW